MYKTPPISAETETGLPKNLSTQQYNNTDRKKRDNEPFSSSAATFANAIERKEGASAPASKCALHHHLFMIYPVAGSIKSIRRAEAFDLRELNAWNDAFLGPKLR